MVGLDLLWDDLNIADVAADAIEGVSIRYELRRIFKAIELHQVATNGPDATIGVHFGYD